MISVFRYEYAIGKNGIKIASIPIPVCDCCKEVDANHRIEIVTEIGSHPLTDVYVCEQCSNPISLREFVESLFQNDNREWAIIEGDIK